MALRQALCLNRGQKKRGETGNLVENICMVEIKGSWESGDVIEVDDGPVSTTYSKVKTTSEGVAGVVVDIGYFDHNLGVHDPDFFAASHDFTTAGETEHLTIPVNMRADPATAVRHSLTFTLKADPPALAVGKMLYLITHAHYMAG